MQRHGVMDDQGIELRQLRREKLLDFRLQGGEFCGDLALVEGVTHRAHLRMTGVQLRNDDELNAWGIHERPAAPAQDGDGMLARRQADGLFIEDGFHATDDRRTGVVQKPDARARRHFSACGQVMTGGSSRITVRSSGFSSTSTCGRPPL